MAALFDPLTLRGITLRNRIGLSPMCQYNAGTDGVPTDWHLVHLGARAAGGAGLVLTEATAVAPEGRICPGDVGIWTDAQEAGWKRIASFVRAQGATPGIQIGHAGRKASFYAPWVPEKGAKHMPPAEGGWDDTVAPSAIPLRKADPAPHELSLADIDRLIEAFRQAAIRADRAGFDWIELHGGHGYLLAGFLSPYSNRRTDAYGGTLENRARFPLACFEAMRAVFPAHKVITIRLSCVEWIDGGQTLEDTLAVARLLKAAGIDLIDCSSGVGAAGGEYPVPPAAPGWQVPFAERIRRDVGLPTAAVGVITEPYQADAIIRDGRADLVLIGRAMLRDPYWPMKAAEALGAFAGEGVSWPLPYGYAVRRK